MRMTPLIWLLLVGAVLVMVAGCVINRNDGRVVHAKHSMGMEVRGIWVTRWDFRSPEDVRRVVADAASIGVTDVFWQVRGQGDSYYRSRIEPWGEELFRDDRSRTDPGFDPLALAVQEAHRRGVRIHAWFNVMPMWPIAFMSCWKIGNWLRSSPTPQAGEIWCTCA